MRGLSRFSVVWPLATALVLSVTVVSSYAVASLLSRPPLLEESVPQPQPSANDCLCKQTFSFSQALSLQDERQSRKWHVLARCPDGLPPEPYLSLQYRCAPVARVLFVHFFFARKLSAPSVSDDPFLR